MTSRTEPVEPSDRSLADAVRLAPGYVAKRAKRWLVSRYYDRYFAAEPDHRALSAPGARAAVAEADGVLFLCWGNICRSPMAERYLRARLEARGIDDVTLRSAGWGEYEGRPSPPDAVDAARRHGVDLADHRSVRLRDEHVRSTDVAFVMDYNDFHALTSRYPEAADRTFFLRAVLGEAREAPRIPDPHGRGPARFEEAYATIARALNAAAAAVEGGQTDSGEP